MLLSSFLKLINTFSLRNISFMIFIAMFGYRFITNDDFNPSLYLVVFTLSLIISHYLLINFKFSNSLVISFIQKFILFFILYLIITIIAAYFGFAIDVIHADSTDSDSSGNIVNNDNTGNTNQP